VPYRDHGKQMARLKRLAQDVDAAQKAVDETFKHIDSGPHRVDGVMTDDTRPDTAERKQTMTAVVVYAPSTT